MRISDWSSDVCSSDLAAALATGGISESRLAELVGATPFVEIAGLRAGYGKMQILHEFSLQIGKGQALCLIGPNGAGKSTVLHSIFGRSEEHTSELQSLMRISYAVFCLKKKTKKY